MTANNLIDIPSTTLARASILFLSPRNGLDQSESVEPAFFADLLLSQVSAAITKEREEYNLLPFLYEHDISVETIKFRHEVWSDLADSDLRQHLTSFAKEMHEIRRRLTAASKSHFAQQRQGWHLDAAAKYCEVVKRLSTQLAGANLSSRGLLGFQAFLSDFERTSTFESLVRETRSLEEALSQVRYCINIRNNHVRVLKYYDEADYSAEIEETFKRFQQGAVKDYLQNYSDWPDMNHVQSWIADRVALLYEEEFATLKAFCERRPEFIDATIASFDRELQFYLAYLDFIQPLQTLGLSFCLPEVRTDSKEVFALDTFDVALARKLLAQRSPVICNSFHLQDPERIMIVSGPNQGGKTTFARTFGQLHYLAGLGCPVPGSRARLFRYDHLFTHFGREEDPTYESGKLEEDLLRIRAALNQATPNSILIMNEIFSSTTVHDALVLGTKVLQKVIWLNLLCVMVTFVDELTLLGPSIVSLTSTVNPENPVERTFKIIRHPADGVAYAIAIAEKYGLTYDKLQKRVSS